MSKIKIALADDHKQMRDIWDLILSANSAFEVVCKCRNGQEAIEAASVHSPDVFIMDINMRPVSGIEATDVITKTHPHIKVLGMSIHKDIIYVKHMLDAGATGYVTKNSSYEEVFHSIHEVYAGRHYICKEVRDLTPARMTSQL